MTKRLHKEQHLELKYKALLQLEKGKTYKELHNYLVFCQIHYTIAEVSGHADVNDKEESDDKEQPTDCISKPDFKDVMNAISVL